MHKRIISIVLIMVLAAWVAEPVLAASISDIKRQQEEAQDKLDEISDSISGIAGEKAEIDAEINEMDAALVELLASISLLEDDIEQKKEEIVIAQSDYEAAAVVEQQQYEAMKIRIKYMYESGDKSYAQLFFEAKNFNDLLNKADYIEKLYEYDRKMLLQYQEIKEEVARLKESLELEKSELESSQFELKEEEVALEEILDEKKAEAKDYEVQLANAKQEAAAYKAKIKEQAEQIKKMEAEAAKKAAEEAARKKEQEKKNQSQNNNSSNSSEEPKENKPSAAGANFDVSIIDNASGSSKGKEIAKYGCQFIGNPYVAGGTSLTNGADCSGFTQSVYKNLGYNIPRNSTAQRAYGTEVEFAQAQPGDIVCYAGHVAIYIGNGLIVHASTAKTGIKISNVTYRPILSIRRIVS